MGEKSAAGVVLPWLIPPVLFACGLVAYLYYTIPSREELVASMAIDLAPSSTIRQVDNRYERATRLAVEFVQNLGAGRTDAAYELMAAGYKSGASLAVFRATCAASPFLSTAKSIAISRTREDVPAGSATGHGALSGSGVLTTGAGAVSAVFSFVDDPAGLAILNVTIAGASALLGVHPAPVAATAEAPGAKAHKP